MSKLVRKNLMVDAEEIVALARARGTSESEAVRYAVAQALASEEVLQALTALSEMGAFADSPRMRELYGPPVTIDPETGRLHVDETPPTPRKPRARTTTKPVARAS
ncbi:MAG: hypothetical protein JOZ87_23485 [Chloroflexi bacterium]|nr:hypothetical protein [Chloroflexota bacterium]